MKARLVLFVVVLGGCVDQSGPEDTRIDALRPFANSFLAVDSVQPEQSEAALVSQVTDVAWSEDGRIAVADARQAQVFAYRQDGSYLFTIGRQGDGPGEFRAPVAVAIDSSGGFHILDRDRRRLEVFRSNGEHDRTIALEQFGSPTDFLLWDRGYLILALDPENPASLHQLEADGSARWRGLPIGLEVADGEEGNQQAWEPARLLSMAGRADTVWAISTLRPTVWKLVPGAEQADRTDLDFTDYLPPVTPDPSSHQIDGMAYLATRHMGAFPVTTRHEFYWPFIQGAPFGDSIAVLLRQDRDRRWHGYTNAPRVVAASGERLIAVVNPGTDDMQFVLFQAR